MTLLARLDLPPVPPRRPVLVMGLEGWVDAGLSGANAIAALVGSIHTEVIATFDADQLVDQRSRRPTQRIVNGVLESLTWPEIQLRHGTDAGGNDVLLLVGPEPDYRWRAFTDEVVRLSGQLGVRLAVGVGGFPAPMPHTRPIRVIATATDSETANDVGFIPGVREVPSGIHASLLKGFDAVGTRALSLWAMVPHYISGMPYPDASVGILDTLRRVSGVTIDDAELRAAAKVTRERIDELIVQKPEHVEMVELLERQADQESQASADQPPLDMENLPSGDELAAELQRWLRERGQS